MMKAVTQLFVGVATTALWAAAPARAADAVDTSGPGQLIESAANSML